MNDILRDVTPAGMIDAIEANLFAMMPLWSRSYLIETHSEPELLWNILSVPFPLFNSVARARLSCPSAEAAIQSAKARSAAREVPLLWWIGPTTTPTNLPSLLEAHEYCEAFDSYLPAAGIEHYYCYDQLGSACNDQPDEPELWELPRFVEEVEQVQQTLGPGPHNYYWLGHSWGWSARLRQLRGEPGHQKSINDSTRTAAPICRAILTSDRSRGRHG